MFHIVFIFFITMCFFTPEKDIKRFGVAVFAKDIEIQHWESGLLGQGITFRIERISVQTSLDA